MKMVWQRASWKAYLFFFYVYVLQDFFFWDLACSEEAKEREARMLVVVVPKFAPTVTA